MKDKSKLKLNKRVKKINIDAKNKVERLMFDIIYSERADLVKKLIEKGLIFEDCNREEDNYLSYAALIDSYDIVNILLLHGFDINSTVYENCNTVSYLASIVKSNCDYDYTEYKEWDDYHLALNKKLDEAENQEIIKMIFYLVKKGCDPNFSKGGELSCIDTFKELDMKRVVDKIERLSRIKR